MNDLMFSASGQSDQLRDIQNESRLAITQNGGAADITQRFEQLAQRFDHGLYFPISRSTTIPARLSA